MKWVLWYSCVDRLCVPQCNQWFISRFVVTQFSGEGILYSICARVESGRIILELMVARVVLRLG